MALPKPVVGDRLGASCGGGAEDLGGQLQLHLARERAAVGVQVGHRRRQLEHVLPRRQAGEQPPNRLVTLLVTCPWAHHAPTVDRAERSRLRCAPNPGAPAAASRRPKRQCTRLSRHDLELGRRSRSGLCPAGRAVSVTAARPRDRGVPFGQSLGQNDVVTIGEELLEERRRRRRAGDTRITPEGREILRRMTQGDLVDEFQAALDADVANDPLLGGHDDDDD